MSDYLFPEFFDDEVSLRKLRERWRYEAMARLPVYTHNYWRKDTIGYIYRYDNSGCKYCGFLSVDRLGLN